MEPSRATANSASAPRAFTAIVVVIGLALGLAALWGANKQALGLFHDDGVYTVVAKSLYQGDGYRIISLPSAPPQTKYPFLYSHLLSGIWSFKPIFPPNIVFLKTVNIAILIGIFFTSVLYYRQHFPDSTVGVIVFAFLICTNPIIFTFTDFVVSDLLYVLLALGALAIVHPCTTTSSNTRHLILLGVISGLACLTRLAAVPLVLAGSVQTFVSRRWRGFAYFVTVVLLFVAPWLSWVSLWPHYAPDSLFAYYSAYDFGSAKAGDQGASLVRQWGVVLGNARYVIETFDLLYLMPLLPGLGFFVALLTGIGLIDTVRKEEAFAWFFFYPRSRSSLSGPFIPAATWHRWYLFSYFSCSAAWRLLSIGFNL